MYAVMTWCFCLLSIFYVVISTPFCSLLLTFFFHFLFRLPIPLFPWTTLFVFVFSWACMICLSSLVPLFILLISFLAWGVDGWVLYQHDSQWGWLKTAEGRKEGSKYGCTYLLIYQARAYLAWIDVCLFGTLFNSLPFLLSMLSTTYCYIPTYVPFRNFSSPSQSISFWHHGHTCWIMYIVHRRYGGVLTSSSTSSLRILRTSSEIPMPSLPLCSSLSHFTTNPLLHSRVSCVRSGYIYIPMHVQYLPR